MRFSFPENQMKANLFDSIYPRSKSPNALAIDLNVTSDAAYGVLSVLFRNILTHDWPSFSASIVVNNVISRLREVLNQPRDEATFWRSVDSDLDDNIPLRVFLFVLPTRRDHLLGNGQWTTSSYLVSTNCINIFRDGSGEFFAWFKAGLMVFVLPLSPSRAFDMDSQNILKQRCHKVPVDQERCRDWLPVLLKMLKQDSDQVSSENSSRASNSHINRENPGDYHTQAFLNDMQSECKSSSVTIYNYLPANLDHRIPTNQPLDQMMRTMTSADCSHFLDE